MSGRHKYNVRWRWFVCPVCREKFMAVKSARLASKKGHRKWLYCWKCKKMRDMIQIN